MRSKKPCKERTCDGLPKGLLTSSSTVRHSKVASVDVMEGKVR